MDTLCLTSVNRVYRSTVEAHLEGRGAPCSCFSISFRVVKAEPTGKNKFFERNRSQGYSNISNSNLVLRLLLNFINFIILSFLMLKILAHNGILQLFVLAHQT